MCERFERDLMYWFLSVFLFTSIFKVTITYSLQEGKKGDKQETFGC